MNRNATTLLAALAAMAASGTPPAAAQPGAPGLDVPLPAGIAAAKVLTVGVNCAYPPAGYIGLDGKPAGYEVALVKRIAEFALGTDGGLAMQCVNDSNRIPFLQSGKVDLVLAALAMSPARAEQIDFSSPIWVSNLQLVVPVGSTIAGYKDLEGKSVVTTTGSLYQAWLQRCIPKANLLTAQSPVEASTMLTQGRVDAFGYIDVYAYNFVRRNPAYKVVGALALPAVQGIGVRKDNKPLLDWVNAAVERLRQEDAFYKAFAEEVRDTATVAKYRGAVPGPDTRVSYAGAGSADCAP
jgi:polar amino acid transport system substrate-binding protein